MTGDGAQWLRAFLLTLAVELPLYLWLLRKRGFPVRAALASALTANGLSHPFLWFVFPAFVPYTLYLLAGESAVIAAETAVLRAAAQCARTDRRLLPLFLVAVAVNAASMAVGLVL